MIGDPTISFYGATGAVTGSCFLLQGNGRSVLIDCGMFQGSKTEKELNYRDFPFSPPEIDAVILTHAHIDHSGLLPKLVKDGCTAPIYCTPATLDLCGVMLPDSAHIQETEVEQRNRRSRRRGKDTVNPIYSHADVMRTLVQMRPLPFEQWVELPGGFRLRFWNAGHLLGSASVEVEVRGEREHLRILFSGDIGPAHKLLQRAPEAPTHWDYVLCESTYGDEDREDLTAEGRKMMLEGEAISAASHQKGALIIPSFAVERTQELLTDLVALMDAGKVEHCPVIIDSPLATRATEVFKQHLGELEHGELLMRALSSRYVRFTESVEQSKALDEMREFHVVIAASGMCEAGRIRHRLKNWLWRDAGTILLVGYQAEGTLGRLLADGARTVRIQGDDIVVRASVRKLDAYSGHADGPELAEWLRQRLPIRGGIFLVHGETAASDALKKRLGELLPNVPVIQPTLDSSFLLGRSMAHQLSIDTPPRLPPFQVGSRDWHNDLQTFILDLQERLSSTGDERARRIILRRVERALADHSNSGDEEAISRHTTEPL